MVLMIELYKGQAIEKLDKAKVKGSKEQFMADAVKEALKSFCEQSEEFAQAVVQGGDFADCMSAVAKDVGSSISDLEAFKKAVRFYFPTATVSFTMRINTEGNCALSPADKAAPAESTSLSESASLSMSLDDLLGL